MLRLITFGGLALTHDAAVLKSHTPRQRMLPLLALLAAAGDRGLPRDRLAALLWPDSDDARARHSLEEVVSQVRRLGRLAGQGDVFAQRPTLALDRGAISADVWDFDAAVAANELERAVALGDAGRFAADVRVEGCDEAERRLAAHGDGYARARAEVLERLARRAADRGDGDGVVRWTQRRANADPSDRRAALALVDALEAQHERARALGAAERYQHRLAELTLPPDPEVADRVRRLRSVAAGPTPGALAADAPHDARSGAAARERREHARLARALGARWVVGGPSAHGSLLTSYAGRAAGPGGAAVEVHVVRPAVAHQADPERFVCTLRRAAGVASAHVLPVLDCGADDDLLYFVAAPRAAASLRSRLTAEAQLPIPDALAVARALAGALALAHDRGVAHGDLRPKHVSLRGPCDPAVGGFGVVDAVAGAYRPGDDGSYVVAFGERAYQSPEQLRHAVRTSPQSDVYAFGAIVYEMLAGERPFAPRGAPVDLAAKLTGAPAALAGLRERVPEALAHVVHTCLARVPADRYASGAALAGALAALDA